MVIVFMVTRLRRSSSCVAVSLGCALLTSACQKVPLLAPSGSTITLHGDDDGAAGQRVDRHHRAVDRAGRHPAAARHARLFTTTLGSIQPAEAETDISGRVDREVHGGHRIGHGDDHGDLGRRRRWSAANAVRIAVGTAAVGSVRVSANPTLLPALGGSSTITARRSTSTATRSVAAPVSFRPPRHAGSGIRITDQSGSARRL